MTNGEYILPKYALKKFKAKNYKGIKEVVLELPKEPKWIFFTGENGSGKTTLLQAIALGFDAERDNKTWRPRGEELTGNYNIKTIVNRFEYRGGNPFKKICCYGSSRLDIADFGAEAEESQIQQLFGTRSYLRNINKKIFLWDVKRNDNRDAEKKEFATKYATVTRLFIELLNLEKIEVDFGAELVYYYEKDKSGEGYKKVHFYQLAAGYRNIISMVGDISGIVIIDELDLHLHPKWQKRLPGLLSKIFPRVQFIASTHSPIPLLGAPEHSVFLKVNRDAEKGITVERLEDMEKQISNLLPNTILSSPIFGMRDIFQIEFNDQVKKELKDYLGTDRAKELEQLFKSE